MQRVINLALSSFLFASSLIASPNPLGEMADYKIDKNPSRTSSMIKSGTVQASVVGFQENTANGPMYDINLKYNFSISLVGNQTGTEKLSLEKEFFTEEFMVKLRKDKHYEGKNFKADHLGFADAKNMDGKFYPSCDKIFLYDIQQPPNFILELLATALEADKGQFEDLKALVHVYKGIPVLGGAKIDITGLYNGMKVKAGTDYIAK